MVLCLASCTSEIGGYIVPGKSLDREGKYYVVVEEEDQRLLYLMLRENIALRGISVSSGSADRIPQTRIFLWSTAGNGHGISLGIFLTSMYGSMIQTPDF